MRRSAGLAGWATLVALALLGAGGAARCPGGILLGAPSMAATLTVLGVTAVLIRCAGLEAARPCLGLLPLPILLLAGVPLPGRDALTGPPLLALAAGGAALALSTTAWRPDRRLLFPVALAVYLVGSVRTQQQVGAQGDEPHYLMVAESLLRDHDLALDRDYVPERYRAFHHGPDLEPHYRVRGRNGVLYSLHAIGLSLLVLPAYAVGGYPAASFFMAVLAALLVTAVRSLCRGAGATDGAAEGIAWVIALSPPLVHFAPLIFTEVPAALLVALGLRAGLSDPPAPLRAVLTGTGIAFLPWLNVRYALLTVILAGFLVWSWKRVRPVLGVLVPCVASAGLIALYHSILYGFLDPRRVYGRRPEFAFGVLPEGLPGLFLDQEFGLFVAAPVLVLALPGLPALARRQPRLAVACVTLLAVVVLVAGAWPMWRGGFNPPGRFLVPMIPVFAIGLGRWLDRGAGATLSLLVGWGLWVGLTGVQEPRLVHRDRDGSAPLFRERSGAEEWTPLLPRYVLAEPDRVALAALWATALGVAALAVRRRGAPAPLTVCLATVGLGATAAAASRLSTAKVMGRDAVRVMARPALQVPGWRVVAARPAAWTPADLDWGPLYEPHRHPGGAVVGGRLPLAVGGYCLSLDAEALAGATASPTLEVQPEPPPAGLRDARFAEGPAGPEACFEVRSGETAVTLRVSGGAPFVLRSVRLRDSTLATPAGLIP